MLQYSLEIEFITILKFRGSQYDPGAFFKGPYCAEETDSYFWIITNPVLIQKCFNNHVIHHEICPLLTHACHMFVEFSTSAINF